MKKQSKGRIVLFPNDQQLKTLGDNLPSFSAHDLRALVKEAESNDKVRSPYQFVFALRRRSDLQLKDLLRGLGVEPIVCTPEDAFHCFMGNDIELLVSGNCMLRKNEHNAALKIDYKDKFELD